MRLQLLYWIEGWVKLIDGLVAILTLGFWRLDFSTNILEKILLELFRVHKVNNGDKQYEETIWLSVLRALEPR